MLTDRKIPVRFFLESLSAETCLAYARRHSLIPVPGQPHVHPLMHQIGSNPDCVSLGIVAEGRLLAHCFFHYRTRQGATRKVLLHTFAVHPHLRRRGLGSLLALHLLRNVLAPLPDGIVLESECPSVLRQIPLLARLCPELGEGRACERHGEAVPGLNAELDRSEGALTERIFHTLITKPEFTAPLLRRECAIAAASADSAFFSALLELPWPPYAAVHPLRINPDGQPEHAPEGLDLLLAHGAEREEVARFLERTRIARPELPIALIGDRAPAVPGPVVFQAPLAELMPAMREVLTAFDPAHLAVEGKRLAGNLLRLPEPAPIARFRQRHPGERLFIAASGPSLSAVDPRRLKQETTLAVNDALLRFPGSRYAAIMDSRKLHELHWELRAVDAVFTLEGNSFGVELKYLGTEGFNVDVERGIYSGYTTTYFALQIAVFMGFRRIYLLGLDLAATADRSHFFGNRPLQDRDRPEVYEKMQRSFEQAAPELERLGVEVYNCSPVSRLKRFPFRSLDEVLRR